MRAITPVTPLDCRHSPVFVITMDTDWCPPAVMDCVLTEIVDPRLPLTVFATGKYTLAAQRPLTEVALHYNVDNASFTEAFKKIAEMLPVARGARGHSLAFSERLRALYGPYHIQYDSSYIMYLQDNVRPFSIGQTTLELPIYFMDMFALEFEQNDLARFPDRDTIYRPGLKVFDFHPIHLLLNTPSVEYYLRVKKWYHDPEQLLRHQNPGYGIRSYFTKVQQWILDSAFACCTCLDVCEPYVADADGLRGTAKLAPAPRRSVA